MNRQLIKWLFETEAFKVCPPGKPFWYTSGKIGPYYINTHFLYGSKEKAEKLLSIIDNVKEDKLTCSTAVFENVRNKYETDSIYKGVIDLIIGYIKKNMDLDKIDYISGGERRDWYFSLLPAFFLNKGHLTLFKDNDAVLFDGEKSTKISDINGAKVLHIADIITEASSYDRAWVPTIKGLNGEITHSLVIVDRLQGGSEKLASLGVNSNCLLKVNQELFALARDMDIIGSSDYDMLVRYYENPVESMRKFLMENPSFVDEALLSDEKTAARARLLREKNFYNL